MGEVVARRLSDLPDEELLVEVRLGNHEAFEVLFQRYYSEVLRYAYSVAWCRADAEDISSDALLRMLLALEVNGGPTTNIPAYLRAIIRRLAIDLDAVNSRTVAIGLDFTVVEPRQSPREEQISFPRQEAILGTAFNSLPARWRHVLWLVDVMGYRPHDLTSTLGIASPAAYSLLWRARTALKKRYVRLTNWHHP